VRVAGRCSVASDFNVLALIKGDERYVYLYDDASRRHLIDAFRDHAADAQLSLTWFDALVLTKKAREQAQTATAASAQEPETRSRI
jgi:hypothetical protein